jgi:DNA-binding LacI/PurR family transcriptional regulator
MSKRATAAEVAEIAGVSRTTVSFVLNGVPGMRISDDTRQRVLDAARQLNYHPDATARRMVSGHTNIIGFVLRQSPDQVIADHFLPPVITGLSQAASAQNFHLLLEPIPPEDHSGVYLRLVQERHVDGIVLSGPRSDDVDLLQVPAVGGSFVLLGQMHDSTIPSIDVNNVGGAELATNHLLQLGHRSIGFISNADLAYTASADRLSGYRQALESAGIPYEANNVRLGSFTYQSGYNAMNELLDQAPGMTAVFVASDTVALGALQAIRNRGLKVPEDISLCGFDDIPLSQFIDPPLTTVRLPAFGLGWGAADLLIRLINGDTVRETHVILDTELVVRQSTGPPGHRPKRT